MPGSTNPTQSAPVEQCRLSLSKPAPVEPVETPVEQPRSGVSKPAPTDATQSITGLGVSNGLAIGPAVIVSEPLGVDPNEQPTTPENLEAVLAAVTKALDTVADRLRSRAASAPESARGILEGTALMAADPGLADVIATNLRAGSGPTKAVFDAAETFAVMFESMGGYMAERAADVHDVRDRVIAELRDAPEPGVPALEAPAILVAHDLAPADTALLRPESCLGIVTELGGPTSHTAILAAQLGIPAVVRATGVTAITPGALLAVNGTDGNVLIDPSPDEQLRLTQESDRRRAAISDSTAPGATADGVPIALLANVGTEADAIAAAAQPVEGVGLFRTEFPFLDREDAPSLAEQTQIYTNVLHAFGDRPVTIRTLDAGADKPLAFADLGPEPNPALGVRALRLCREREDLIETQLQAVAAAQRATGATVRVMAPMVANITDAEWFASKAHAAGLDNVGVMIEIPAAALRAGQILQELDFASLGTNDLQQYTMAADRLQGGLAELLNPWEPAVLDLIGIACEGARQAGKPICVCGESGGNPGLALVLVGLGVTSLSMAPSKVPAVRTVLAKHTLARCQELAALARRQRTWREAREAVLTAADPVLRALS